MKLNKSLAIATLGIATLALFPSCQDEDFGYTAQQIKTSKFAQNFENQYGPIDPDQSWDLTNYMTRTAKYDDEALVDYLLQNGGQTRAGDGSSDPIGSLPDNCGLAIDEDGYYHVEPNTIKWLRSFLKEKKNNTDLGSAFSLRSPGNKVAIIPIYQGFANMDWSLWLRRTGANAGDTKLWTESENILVSNDGSTWSEKGTTYGTSQTVYDLAIKSKPIVIDLQEGENFNLFLQIDNNNGKDTFSKTGTIQLSSMGMMLALPCPIPTNLGTTGGQDNLAMIVGVEDSDLEESDWDMNDVCFLIVGLPNLPNRVDITRKRYMCEDLGNTYDFDFNDIVVDVMEVQTSKYDASKNYFVKDGAPTQIATLKHVCGTLPFQVKVGNTTFNPVSDPTNVDGTNANLREDCEDKIVNLPGTPTTPNGNGWNPEFSIRIEGWDHNENNVEVLVSVNTNEESLAVFTDAFGYKDGDVTVDGANHIYHITFPREPGDAPLIIATDPTLMWMNEHQNIPDAWWKEGTFKPTGSADNDAPVNPGSEGTDTSWKDIPEHLVTPDADGNVVIWDAADHKDAETDEEKGIFDGWKGIDFQTEFLDALFEGYTIIEFQFGDGNTAETFRLCKVTDNWDTVIATPTISNGKATYTFPANALTEYNLGVAILNIGDSGKKMVLNKVIMRMPTSYTLTVNDGDHGTVSVSPASADGKYTEGTVVTVTATPKSGWYFDQWNDGNKSRVRQITISGDITLEPSYTDEDPYTQEEGNVELSRQETILNNWSNSIEINRNDFHEGDVIVIKVKSYGPDAVIGIKADWDAITDNFSPVEGDIAYTLTAANAQAINNKNKLRIQGNDVTISSVTKRCDHITEPDPIQQDINLDEVVNFEITKWSDAAKISATQLSNIKVGDKLVISLKDVKSGAQMQVSEMSGDWSNKIVSGYDLNESTSKEIEVTDANIANIKNGIAIQGHDFTLVKVELVEATTPIDPENPEEPKDPEEEDTDQSNPLWEIETTLNWNSDVHIDYSTIEKCVGKTLYITFELVDNAEYHTIRITNQDWSWNTENNNDYNWSPSENGTINKVISQDLITNLNNQNLVVSGYGCKVTKIEAK